jgi:hypothetical protein
MTEPPTRKAAPDRDKERGSGADLTSKSKGWVNHTANFELERNEIGVPHHRWRRAKHLPNRSQCKRPKAH